MKKHNFIIFMYVLLVICISSWMYAYNLSDKNNLEHYRGQVIGRKYESHCKHSEHKRHYLILKPINKPYNKIAMANVDLSSYLNIKNGTIVVVNSKDHFIYKEDVIKDFKAPIIWPFFIISVLLSILWSFILINTDEIIN